jgi:hypothetical protein
MTQFSFRFPRAYRLKPVGQREEDALSLVEDRRTAPLEMERSRFAGYRRIVARGRHITLTPAWMTSLLRELTPAPIPLSLSTTITSRPARASARATARPMSPAPTTRHSTDSIPQLSVPGDAFLGANTSAGSSASSQKTWRRGRGRRPCPAQPEMRPSGVLWHLTGTGRQVLGCASKSRQIDMELWQISSSIARRHQTPEIQLQRCPQNRVNSISGFRGQQSGFVRSGIVFTRCFVPDFDGSFLSNDSKDALWDRFYTGAPQRQRRSVERYSIVMSGRRSQIKGSLS